MKKSIIIVVIVATIVTTTIIVAVKKRKTRKISAVCEIKLSESDNNEDLEKVEEKVEENVDSNFDEDQIYEKVYVESREILNDVKIVTESMCAATKNIEKEDKIMFDKKTISPVDLRDISYFMANADRIRENLIMNVKLDEGMYFWFKMTIKGMSHKFYIVRWDKDLRTPTKWETITQETFANELNDVLKRAGINQCHNTDELENLLK